MFFFLMIRRPPRSTLFPYTTPSDLRYSPPYERAIDFIGELGFDGVELILHDPSDLETYWTSRKVDEIVRSEEHTSELQSRQYLVCRLLLEKKKHVLRVSGRQVAR